MHPDMWYQLNVIRHHDGCQLVHPAKWEHFFNAIRHHDGCQLVHPAKWDIGQFRGAFVTNVDWCIPSGGSFCISFNSFSFQIPHFNSIFTFVSSFQRYTQSMYSFHILIHILIHILKIYSIYVLIAYTHSHTHSYNHSCTYFIYSFTYSFMYLFYIYSVNYQNT